MKTMVMVVMIMMSMKTMIAYHHCCCCCCCFHSHMGKGIMGKKKRQKQRGRCKGNKYVCICVCTRPIQHAVIMVRVDNELSEEFLVEVMLHQGSVSNPFSFIIVLWAITEELQTYYPREHFCADDLALIAQLLPELEMKFQMQK